MSTSRTYTTGQVLTAAQQNDLAQGTIGSISTIVASGIIGTTSGTATTFLTAPAVTLVAGRRIKVFFEGAVLSTVGGDQVLVQIMEGATILVARICVCTVAAVGIYAAASIPLTPSAGSHTYLVSAYRLAGTGNCSMFANAAQAAFLNVEDIGI